MKTFLVFLLMLSLYVEILTERGTAESAKKEHTYMQGVSEGKYAGCIRVFYNWSLKNLPRDAAKKMMDFEKAKDFCEAESHK